MAATTEKSSPIDSDDQRIGRTDTRGQKEVLGDLLPQGAVDPVYQAKAEALNAAIQEIGFGKYQAFLFVVTGFGWMVDNLWPVSISLILTPVVNEFHTKGPFLPLSQNIGLLFGAVIFGLGCDVWGRRLSFNTTLLIVGIFATAAAGSPTFAALCVFASIWSIGVGGNLPVDSAIFLEFLPGTHQYLLTVLSIWWAFGQLLGSLVAWALLPNHSCQQTATTCPKSQNMGWRYYVITMGGLMLILWFIRFFIFHLYESPKYLMGRGRDEEAVAVIHKVAAYNGKTTSFNLEDLSRYDKESVLDGKGAVDTSAKAAILRNTERFKTGHVKALFRTKKLAWSTGLVILIWGLIGLAFPLYNAFVPYYLATRGAKFGDGSTYITYRNEVIMSVLGIPGALVGGWAVDVPGIGRKGALSISTVLTGIFLFAGTTARTSNSLLGWNCGYTFTSNVISLITITDTSLGSYSQLRIEEPVCGNGLAAAANRIFGIMAPIIALEANLTTSVPIWIAGTLFVVAGLIALLIPLEVRGKASL